MTEPVNEQEVRHLGDFAYKVGVLDIVDIDIGERFRKEFPGIAELASSIKQLGVMNSIAVIDKEASPEYYGAPDHDDSKRYLLSSGERRIKASLMAGKDTIPARIFDHPVNEYQYRLSELHENVYREAFTPIEKQQAYAETHRLLVKVYGKQHKAQDTAAHLNIDTADLSRARKIDKVLRQFPDIREAAEAASTDKDLKRIVTGRLKRAVQEERVARLKARIATTSGKGPNPDTPPAGTASTGVVAIQPTVPVTEKTSESQVLILQRQRNKIISGYHVGDFFDLVKKIPERSVDLLELDPDWGIDFDVREEGKGDNISDSYTAVAPDLYVAQTLKIAEEAYRVMKDHSWAIVWFSMEHWLEETKAAFIKHGFFVSGMPGIWNKDELTGGTATPAYRLADNAAAFFYVRKGNCRITQDKMGRSNVFSYRRPRKNERFHKAEKPIELYEELILTFSNPGARCVTGFAGSGNFILGAVNTGRNAMGFDLMKSNKDNFILKVHEQEPGKYKTYKTT